MSQTTEGVSERPANIETIHQTFKTLRTAIRSAGVFGCVWVLGQALSTLAGKDTDLAVDAALSLVAETSVAISFSVAGLCAIWAVAERWIRQRALQRQQTRLRELEQYIDPGRSSSQLTEHGETNPSDRD
jgi:hypothetical protein